MEGLCWPRKGALSLPVRGRYVTWKTTVLRPPWRSPSWRSSFRGSRLALVGSLLSVVGRSVIAVAWTLSGSAGASKPAGTPCSSIAGWSSLIPRTSDADAPFSAFWLQVPLVCHPEGWEMKFALSTNYKQANFIRGVRQRRWLMRYATSPWVGGSRPDEVIKKNSMAWVRERTIPTEQPPLVGEVSANFWE
jgi:hypothetical protein